MSEHAIYNGLLEATGLTREAGETEQDYLKRIVKFVATLPDDTLWDTLTEETQEWINASVKAIKAHAKNLPEIPGGLPDAEASDPPVDADDPSGTAVNAGTASVSDDSTPPAGKPVAKASKKKTTKKKAPASKPAKPAKPTKAAKPAKSAGRAAKTSGGGGNTARLKTIMLTTPGITRDKLITRLKDEGVTLSDSTIKVFYSDMLGTIKVLRTLGLLDDE